MNGKKILVCFKKSKQCYLLCIVLSILLLKIIHFFRTRFIFIKNWRFNFIYHRNTGWLKNKYQGIIDDKWQYEL